MVQKQRVLDVAGKRDEALRRALRPEFVADAIQREFRLIDSDQNGRLEGCDLATQFRADRAASSCHQHHLPRQQRLDLRTVDRHRIAPQQIFQVEPADARQKRHALVERGQAWQHHGLQTMIDAQRKDTLLDRHRRGRHGDDDVLHRVLCGNARQFRKRAENGPAQQVAAVLDRIVVEQADQAPFR